MFLVECSMFYLPLEEDSYVRNSWNGTPFLSVKYSLSLVMSIQDKLLEVDLDEH